MSEWSPPTLLPCYMRREVTVAVQLYIFITYFMYNLHKDTKRPYEDERKYSQKEPKTYYLLTYMKHMTISLKKMWECHQITNINYTIHKVLIFDRTQKWNWHVRNITLLTKSLEMHAEDWTWTCRGMKIIINDNTRLYILEFAEDQVVLC